MLSLSAACKLRATYAKLDYLGSDGGKLKAFKSEGVSVSLAADGQERLPVRRILKDRLKAILRPIARAARPTAESLSRLGARTSLAKQGVQLSWFSEWNDTLDQALDELPPPPCCTRDQYRMLLQATGVNKLHILATQRGEVVAVVSLRRRANAWEPVSYQSITGYIAPSRDVPILGVVLNALGLEVHLTGLGEWADQLNATDVYKVEVPQIRLQENFEEFWHLKHNGHKHIHTIRNARRKCERFEVAIDQPGDLEWVMQQWAHNWRNDPANEIVSTADRLAFYGSLQRSPTDPTELTYHTVTLREGERTVAGLLHSRIGDTLIYQATARERAYARDAVGVAVLDTSAHWAAQQGWSRLDLAGTSAFKRAWAPTGTVRRGVAFRPKMIGMLNRIASYHAILWLIFSMSDFDFSW
jgi:Acetyltransferase (GNAT) domain